MICVRISADQYKALQDLCTINGSQSLSTFARDAMQARINGLSTTAAQRDYVQDLSAQLHKLDRQLDELLKTITSSIAELKR
jgi:hypothetical protein